MGWRNSGVSLIKEAATGGVLYKKAILKISQYSLENTYRPAALSKRDSITCVLLWILQNFREQLLWRTSANQRLLLLEDLNIIQKRGVFIREWEYIIFDCWAAGSYKINIPPSPASNLRHCQIFFVRNILKELFLEFRPNQSANTIKKGKPLMSSLCYLFL